jgi:riboflavin kinase/FMN adenylyltransferase
LLDFSGDLYGQQVSVTFEHFLRSERKFDGLEAIKSQLELDVSAARGLVGRK